MTHILNLFAGLVVYANNFDISVAFNGNSDFESFMQYTKVQRVNNSAVITLGTGK